MGFHGPPPPSDRSERSPIVPSSVRSKIRMVDTTDIDHARAVFRRIYADSTLEPPPDGSFGWSMDLISSGPVKVTIGDLSGGIRAAAPAIADRPYIIMLSGGEAGEIEVAGARYGITPRRSAAVLSPTMATKITLADGFLGRNITIERGALEAHLMALTGRALSAPITFDVPLDITARPGGALYDVAQLFRREVEQEDASPHMVAALRDTVLTSLLTHVPHSASRLFEPAPPRIAPGCVKRAEEFIDAHATEPITLTQIAAAAGVPARSLRAAFTARHGIAPMEFLRRRRFELARRWLLDAPPGTTVVSVVKALGLGDAGRFSVEYKRRFGQSPSQALVGGRSGAGPIVLRAAY